MFHWPGEKGQADKYKCQSEIEVAAMRPRGCPRKRWMICVRWSMKLLDITDEDALDIYPGCYWRSITRVADPAPMRDKR